MLARRPNETNNIIALTDHDEVGGAGLAEARADPVELGADG